MSLFNELTILLQQDPRLVADGQLLKNQITELALKLDSGLLRLLLSHPRLKEHFFVAVDGVLVFDKEKFIRFVNNKAFLPDSYTSFKNKIGLTTSDGRYLSESRDVVLAWPYKDCVLEGGQTQEDQKRDEIFWNEILAPDEIDRLLAPKVLTGWRRYDADGEHPVTEFGENDNLILKGNNLLALHSLKKRYAGKVKLVYIDPPFNTSGAANTFTYNNTFNHSSWLSFMKNRLDTGRQMLREDGVLVVAIDNSELFYLGVLLDEIFGRDNRMGVIAVVHNPGGRQDDRFFPTAHEYMLFYAKDINLAKIGTLGHTDEKLSQFRFADEYGRYKLRGFRRSGSNSRKQDRPGLFYPIYFNPQKSELALHKVDDSFVEILPIDEQGIHDLCTRNGQKAV